MAEPIHSDIYHTQRVKYSQKNRGQRSPCLSSACIMQARISHHCPRAGSRRRGRGVGPMRAFGVVGEQSVGAAGSRGSGAGGVRAGSTETWFHRWNQMCLASPAVHPTRKGPGLAKRRQREKAHSRGVLCALCPFAFPSPSSSSSSTPSTMARRSFDGAMVMPRNSGRTRAPGTRPRDRLHDTSKEDAAGGQPDV